MAEEGARIWMRYGALDTGNAWRRPCRKGNDGMKPLAFTEMAKANQMKLFGSHLCL